MKDSGTITGRIEGLNEYGEGFFRHAGHVLKVARTAPGDLVRVRAPALAKHYLRADALELLEAGPHRVAPDCPHFRDEARPFEPGCGGCQWLHVGYAAQLKAKSAIVEDLLRRSGLRVAVRETVGMANPRACRNKMSLANVGGRLAFYREYSQDPVFPRTCGQECPENQALWELIRDWDMPPELLQVHLRGAGGRVGVLFFAKRYGDGLADLARRIRQASPAVRGVGAASYRSFRMLEGDDDLSVELGGFAYGLPLDGFFQTNYEQALALRDFAVGQLAPRPDDRVLDLYCGAAFFSLPIARRSHSVLGVEDNRSSVDAAVANSRRNRVGNVRYIRRDAAAALRALEPGEHRLVLLDPPRAGCGPAVAAGLARLAPERIVYVSCSPESLAADLAALAGSGYRAVHCQPFDLFPHTHHVETVVTLARSRGPMGDTVSEGTKRRRRDE